ncbi:MAG: spermidine synthase, partial [Planctomycetes bacterium]|nr:spermidine synthase [Planctomycetota bacterium]
MNPANLLRACLLFASGAAAVAFELAAVRQFAAVGGGTVLAAAAVTAAFLGFLALGAWGSGRVADLVSRPLALFAALACAGGVAILLAPWAADAADAVLVLAFGGGAWLRPCALFAAAALFVAVPALLLGDCLPAMTAELPNL